MKFIVNPTEKNPFKAKHFKFLGRYMNPLLKVIIKDIKGKIRSLLLHVQDIETFQV